jgi:hypothetical protein
MLTNKDWKFPCDVDADDENTKTISGDGLKSINKYLNELRKTHSSKSIADRKGK